MTVGARILLVEDEDDARELLVSGLKRLGYQAHGACDGLAAVEQLDQPWDAVVTDLMMPRMNGIQVLAAVREKCPGAVRVVITSFGDRDRVISALNNGADYLIEKPFSTKQIAEILGRLLAERKQSGNQIDQLFSLRLAELNLSERERSLVVFVLKGLPNKDIARNLNIGEQTVKNYLGNVYSKLGVSSRSELFHLIFPV